MTNDEFDPRTALVAIRHRRRIARRRAYQPSKLDDHRAALVELRESGASYPELVTWLYTQHGIGVAHTTVMRYLKKLPDPAVLSEDQYDV